MGFALGILSRTLLLLAGIWAVAILLKALSVAHDIKLKRAATALEVTVAGDGLEPVRIRPIDFFDLEFGRVPMREKALGLQALCAVLAAVEHISGQLLAYLPLFEVRQVEGFVIRQCCIALKRNTEPMAKKIRDRIGDKVA